MVVFCSAFISSNASNAIIKLSYFFRARCCFFLCCSQLHRQWQCVRLNANVSLHKSCENFTVCELFLCAMMLLFQMLWLLSLGSGFFFFFFFAAHKWLLLLPYSVILLFNIVARTSFFFWCDDNNILKRSEESVARIKLTEEVVGASGERTYFKIN